MIAERIAARVAAEYVGVVRPAAPWVSGMAYRAAIDSLHAAEDEIDALVQSRRDLRRALKRSKRAAAAFAEVRRDQEICKNKRRYETRLDTRSDAGRWGHRAYQCLYCRGWHLTSH